MSTQAEIFALQISDDMKGFLLSPFHFCKQDGYVSVPEDSFKEMIDFITELALIKHADSIKARQVENEG